jgi:DNA repair protein RadC
MNDPVKRTPQIDDASGHRARLRERFLGGGADAVAEYELLEMVLYSAKPRGDVKPLAKTLIKRFGGFAGVVQATPEKLREVQGVGDAVVAALKVVEASCHHLLREQLHDRPIINSWTSLLDYCRLTMGSKTVEEFRIFFLNNKNMVIEDEVQQTGTVDHTPVYPREVMKRALEVGASALILAHNHPSGDPTPSKADIDMTRTLCDAARPLNIRIHDHLIISRNKHYSFKSNGLL